MTDYSYQEYRDGSNVSVCLTLADTFWSKTYFLGGTFIFFVVPLAILVILYSMMALNLMSYPGIVSFARQDNSTSAQRYRKQVILMLGTVVLFFFISLLPFRALIVWIVLVPHEEVMALGNEKYYNLLYFCRIMFYLNSAINPILYNLMSTKFRSGFFKLCGLKKKCFRKHTRALLRNSTFNTSSLTAVTTSSVHRASVVESGHHRERSRSVNRSIRSDQSRRNSCSKSASRNVIRCRNSGSRAGIYVEKCHYKNETDRCRRRRRKSFGDFLSSRKNPPVGHMNHSRSLDSVFKTFRGWKSGRRDIDFISLGGKVCISGERDSRLLRNGRSSLQKKMVNGEAEQSKTLRGDAMFVRHKPDDASEIYV